MATSCLLGAVLTLVGFAISHKRIKFDEYDDGRNIRNFNIFTINFAPSGGGKDKGVCQRSVWLMLQTCLYRCRVPCYPIYVL